MIYFKKIKYKNLLSTGNVFTEIDLCSRDTTLIVGQNGAGKSTLLDALSFALFGKPFRKITKPQLINSITGKNCVVELEFSIGTNQYKIIRGIKPNTFEVYQNGDLLNQSADVKDYQEILEKQILKVNHKSFNQVVILGSATFQPFMQLPGGQRREVIEDLLDLQIFTTMNLLLKDKLLKNNDEINSAVSEKKLLESKIEMTKEHLKEIQINTDKLIEEKQESLKEHNNQIMELYVKQNMIINQIEELQLQVEDNEAISKKINKLSQLRHQINARMSLLHDDVKFFHDNSSCPTCNQDIEEEFKNKSITEKQDQIKEIEDGLVKLSQEYEKADNRLKEIMEINSKIQNLQMDKIELNTNMNSISRFCKLLQNEINELENKQTEEKDIKITDFENNLKEIENKYNELSEEKNILTIAGAMLKDGGIKSKIIRQYIPVINKLINKYLSAMDFFVSFELDDQFNETIKSRYRDDFTYASFSEGEKQKIDLALLFTWRAVAKLRNSINTNLLIMDEVFDSSLDQNATDYLMNIIREVSKDSNIFIISHKEHMNEKFNNTIKFIKNKNFSQIQE